MGIMAMCCGQIVTAIVGYAICTHYTRIFIGYSFVNQLRDFILPLVLSAIMGVAVFIVCRLMGATLVSLVTGIAVGIITYYAMALLFQKAELQELYSFIKRKKEA